jgi:hypothetical protein
MRHVKLATAIFGAVLLLAAPSIAQQDRSPDEAEQILRDSQKQDPETPHEVAQCMEQWSPGTQMTKEEWAASCRNTLKYFPETTPAQSPPTR